jgi:DNA-binding NarL/FixJ family response regulator
MDHSTTTPPSAPTPLIRILLADDHPILLAGLRTLIDAQPDMHVVGVARDGAEAIERAKELKPDVIIMDIAMPKMDGLEAMRRIRDLGLPCKMLALTMHAEAEYLFKVLEDGGSGYVLKQGVDSDLFEAIRTVVAGNVFLYPSATRLLLSRYLEGNTDEERDEYGKLSEREREVLKLTAEGYSSQEIADQLILSPKTIETYRSRLMQKLNLHHRSELVRFALRRGLLKANGG